MTPPKFDARTSSSRLLGKGQRWKERMKQPKMWSSWRMLPPHTHNPLDLNGFEEDTSTYVARRNREELWGPRMTFLTLTLRRLQNPMKKWDRDSPMNKRKCWSKTITDRPESTWREEEEVDAIEVRHICCGIENKGAPDSMEITLPLSPRHSHLLSMIC
jgi:hypothetical protein